MIPSLPFAILHSLRGNATKRLADRNLPRTHRRDFPIRGFTLIEILLALSIFAIIATLSASVISHAFKIRERITHHADKNNQLWASMMLFQREIQQIIPRDTKKNAMQRVGTFIGQAQYIEFTRGGFINPGASEKRSNLKRVAYICHPPQLIRRTWPVLDVVKRSQFQDKVILTGIESCHFAFLNEHLDVFTAWQASTASTTQPQTTPLFPKAIQFNISFNEANKLSWLAIIPSGLYADV